MGTTSVRHITRTAQCIITVIVMGFSAAPAQIPDGSFSSPVRFGQQNGEVIYRTICQGCHMPSGEGAVGAAAYPALANSQNLAAAGYAAYVVVNGSRAMPPFGQLLDDNQIAEVVNYVRTHFGNTYTDVLTAGDVKSTRH